MNFETYGGALRKEEPFKTDKNTNEAESLPKDLKEEGEKEMSVLSKIAENPKAKKAILVMAFMTASLMADGMGPKKAEAGFAQFFEKTMQEIGAPVKELKSSCKEYSKLKRRDADREEHAKYREGRAVALREIAQHGRPKIPSWGSRRSDRKRGPYWQGYFSEVRRFEGRQSRMKKRSRTFRGKTHGKQQYMREQQ